MYDQFLKQCPVFAQFFQRNYLQFCLAHTFIFCLFSSDTLQVLMFVCPTVQELCFYGCCHPCYTDED